MTQGASASRLDVYRQVTDTFIAQIEAGAGTYEMPWHHPGSPVMRPRNSATQTFYRGINVLTLWAAARSAGYTSGVWATYRQWQLLNAQVRKGERGQLIVFWKQLDQVVSFYTEEEEEQEASASPRFVARGFWVFNVDQVDGYQPFSVPTLPESARISRADQFWINLGIETRFGGDRAYYDPKADYVQMPHFNHFRSADGYYGTLLHEGAHASGAPQRLNRDLTGRFGSEAYAFEELIAELASAFACMTLDITPEPRSDHAPYIASWLKVLRGDTRAVFVAASKAQGVVDWMYKTSRGA